MKVIIPLVALLACAVSAPLTEAAPPVKILPLGDSLTSGYSVPTYLSGYRDRLYAQLVGAGYDLDFLGTQVDTQNPALLDPNHEGHGGYRIDQIDSGIPGWLTAVAEPDVILLIIGTNDFTQNNNPAGAPDRLENLISQIASLRPDAKILLANLPLRTDSATLEADQSAFNAAIPGIVSDQVLLGHHVYFVDMHSSFNAGGLSSDGVHPNPAGYDAMADVWAQAIMQIIPPPSVIPSILTNGSFELGTLISTNPYTQYGLDSWSATGNVAGFPGNSNSPPTNGSRMGLFNGADNTFTGAISQTFATTPGTTYRLDFNLGIIAAAGQAPRQQLLGVALTGDGGGVLNAYDVPLTANEGPAQWTPRSCLFTATTATTTLAFTDKSGTLASGVANFSDMLLDHVRVNVAPPNSAPVADNDSYSTTTGATLVVAAPGVLEGDTDADPQILTAQLVTGPAHGSLTLNPDGSFSYTLGGGGFTGTDSFTYKANDGSLDSNVATVSLVVTPAQPLTNGSFELGALISNSPYPHYQMDAWTTTGAPCGYQGNSSAVATDGSRMALFNGGGNNFTGSVSQTFATIPGESYRLQFDLGIIAGAGQAPRRQLLGVALTAEGGGSLFLQDMPLTAIEGPAQWAGRSFSFTATSATTTLAFTDKSGTLGSGVADFCDLLLDHVRVNVAPPNTPPVADDESYSTDWNIALAVAAPGVLDGDTDVDSPTLTAALVTSPSHGSLILNPNGSFSYTPDSGFVGTDSFIYHANDGSVDSNAATVTIVVNPPGALANGSFELGALISATPFPRYQLNDWTATGAPFGFPGNPVATATDGSRMALFNGGSDIYTDTLAQTFATTPGVTYRLQFDLGIVVAAGQATRQQLLGVALTGDGGGSLIAQDLPIAGNPGPAQWTPKSFTFTASTATTTLVFTDKSGTLAPGVADFADLLLDHVRVSVVPPNTAPVADDDSYSTAWATPLVVASPGVLDGDTDDDFPSFLTAELVAGTSNGNLTLNLDGTFTYTPNSGFAGTDSFSYKANDGLLDSNTATVDIIVNLAGPLANGSFELGALISTTPFTQYQLDNWTATGELSGFPENGVANATDGVRLALFNGGSDIFTGALSQTIATTPGVTYHLKFDCGIVVAGQASSQQLLGVAASAEGGGPLASQDLLLTGNAGPALWTAGSCTFTATSATTTLSFTDKSGTLAPGAANFSDLLLDRVQVVTNTPPVAIAQSVTLDEDVPTLIPLAGSDVDGTPLTFTVTTGPSHGALSGTIPNLTYTPAANYNGPDSFEFKVNDGTVDSAPAAVTITIAPLNDAPLALAQSLNVDEDVPTPVTLSGSDVEASTLTFTVTAQPLHGTLGGAAPNLTYTPAANYHGPDSFEFKVNDGTVDSALATVSITVAPLNDAPLALAQSLNLDEDVPTPVTLAGSDVDGDPLTFTVTQQPLNGTLGGTLPNLTYTPAANYNGPDSFAFTANDGTVDSAPATVTITVAPLNDAPLAIAQSLNLNEDAPTPVTLSGSDVEASALTFTVTQQPLNGTLGGTAPNLTYTPAANYNGPDSFEFKVNDGTVDSGPATVTLTVAPINDAPLADNDSYSTPWAIELAVAAPGVLDGDTDVDSPALTAVPLAGPANGSLTLNPDGSFSYMPNTGFGGTDSFTYRANDGNLNSNTATVTIVVNPAGPLANGSFELGALISTTPFTRYKLDNWTATGELSGFPGNAVANATDGVRIALFNGGSDIFTGALSQTIATTPGVTYHLKFDCGIVVAGQASSQQLLGVAASAEGGGPLASQDLLLTGNAGPALWTAGSCTFTATSATTTLSFTDKSGTLAPGAANFSDLLLDRVQVVTNTPPVAIAQSVTLDEDVPTLIPLAGSDVDGTPLTFTVTTGPSHGTLSGTIPNLTYTPAANYNGPDSFEFKVNDGTVDSAPAAVTITIAPLNDAPLALVQSLNVDEDVPTPVTLSGSDVEASTLTFTVTAQPLHGTLGGAAPNLTYTPAANYHGPDSFEFKVNDGTVDSALATVSITVAPLNDAPLALAQSLNLDEDVPTPVTLAGSDVDGDSLTFTVTQQPLNGTLGGTLPNLTYTPAANYNGPDSFAFTANDGTVDSAPATVTITVAPLNDAPLAIAQSLNLNEDAPTPVTLAGSDVDGGALTFTVAQQPLNGTLGGTAPNLTYTPAANYNGPDSFEFKVNDGTVDSAPATVALTVAPINDAPVADNDSYSTPWAIELAVAAPGVLDGDTDVDSPALTAVPLAGPANGSLTLNPDGSFSYMPNTGFGGTDSFTYRANDGNLNSNMATVTIVVNPAGPLANGSFELGALISNTPFTRYKLDNWTATGELSGFPGNAVANATDGVRIALFNGGSDIFTGALSQTIATTPGVTYHLKFDCGIVVAGQASSQQLLGVAASAEGGGPLVSQDLPLTAVEGPSQWTAKSILFTATTATTTLTFTDKSGTLAPGAANFSDLLLDRVQVVTNTPPLAIAQSVTLDEDVPTLIPLAGSDVDGTPLTFTVTTGPSHGTLSGTIPNLTYTPAANYNGPDSFEFKVNDGTVDSAPAAVTITIAPLNDAPLALVQSLNVDEDVPTPVTLSGSDVEASTLTFTVTAQPLHGTLGGAAPNLTYTPAANYHGPDSFEFKVNDGTVDSALATVSITVAPLNDAPLALAQSLNLDEDVPTPVTLAGSDVDGDSLTFTVTQQPLNGTLGGTLPNLTYTPAANYNGPDSFAFTANDGTVDSAPATVTITVAPLNDAPLAIAQSLNLNEDAPTPVTLSGSDVEASALTFTVTQQPLNGTLGGTAPNLTYTPAANYNGPDSFEFKVNDGTVDSAPATVTLTVAPINDAPLADNDSYSTPWAIELAVAAPGVLDGDTDVDSPALTAVPVTGPANGSLTLNPDGSFSYMPNTGFGGTDSFTYRANDGNLNSNTATVTIVVNPAGPLANGSFELGALISNTPFTRYKLDNWTATGELSGFPGNAVANATDGVRIALFNGGSDIFTGALSQTIATTPGVTYHLKFDCGIVVAGQASSQQLLGVAASAEGGGPLVSQDLPLTAVEGPSQWTAKSILFTATTATTTLTFTDKSGTLAPGAADFSDLLLDHVRVTATSNNPPLAVNDGTALTPILTVAEDSAASAPITVLANDSDPELDTLTITGATVTNPAHGTVAIIASGTALSFTPAADFNGDTTLSYTISDGNSGTASATVFVTVTPLNDAPLAVNDGTALTPILTVAEDSTASAPITVLANDSDPELDTLTITGAVVTNPAHGSVAIVASGTALSFTPAADFNGDTTLSYTISDGNSGTASATVFVTVTPLNDAPLAVNDGALLTPFLTVAEDSTASAPITVLANDSDPELDTLTITDATVTNPAHGTVAIVASGTALSFTPAADFNGATTLSYTISDGNSGTASATVFVSVTPLNDAPLAVNDGTALTPFLTVAEDSAASAPITVLANDSDPDLDTLTITGATVANPAHGTVAIIASGTALSFTPAADFNGATTLSYTISDGNSGTASATVFVTVTPVTDNFVEWLADFGMTGNPGDDPDHDSITNAVEYVVGGNPENQSNLALLPSISLVSEIPNPNFVVGNYLRFSYRRTQLAEDDPSTTIKTEWSEDLTGPWTTADGSHGEVIVEVQNGVSAGIDRVDVYILCPPSGRLFGRLGVAIDTP